MTQSTLSKDRSTRSSWKTRLLCAVPILILGRLVGAIIFGFMITNLAVDKSPTKSPKSIDNGDKVVICHVDIEHKDLNDMANYGINVKSVVQSNVYQGLEAKLKLSNWKI